MQVMRKIIQINEELCNGCGQCVPNCAEGALAIVDGKARVIADKYCDGLGACLGECPTGALSIIERLADDFDEKAVHELLARRQAAATPVSPSPALACGCPSAQVKQFDLAVPCEGAARHFSAPAGETGSRLTHWPIKIRLVPAKAPFLKDADLLIAADCTGFSLPDFHGRLLNGKVILTGCPKFDEREQYVAKFAEIFANAGVKSLQVAIMEVPCCAGMRAIVSEGLARAGVKIPATVTVVSARGEILRTGPF